ncbi:MAG: hypothetical protein CSA39_06740 [Flavobacteriales bacterium]|nr:MAG: hypothetical protein CR989_00850 [Flavobacteriales bacterium]PIE48642.1 MAG: hypothetical protein CSA39_06740 [Flavobacteriales bacterium]
MLCIIKLYAQEEDNAISTALPYLLIAPDARSGGMGDVGVATSSDVNSQHFNPAKYAFAISEHAIGVNYSPWLRNLTDDIFVGTLVYARRLNERSAAATSFKYFSLGTIPLTDGVGNELGVENLNELAFDVSYALKLNNTFAMSVAARYLRTDYSLNVNNSEINTINTFAVDVAGYYQSREKNYGTFNGRWRGGFNIENIGPKVSYTDSGQESFIPTNLRLGGGFDFILDDLNTISATAEFTKLLVPTPPIRDNQTGEILKGKNDDINFISGIFQSFGDAPDGFSEELKEVTWALGAEYIYDQTMALRAGFFNENEFKGKRKFFTLGAGFKYKMMNIDMSYLINASDVNNPLENTLRFSLTFNFGDIYEDFLN